MGALHRFSSIVAPKITEYACSMSNSSRGLKLAGSEYVFLDEGAFGTVFVDRLAGRVRKILRRTERAEEHCRLVMQTELCALIIAEQNAELTAYTAAPFSKPLPINVIDGHGVDVTAEFYADAGFESAYIYGTFHKINTVSPLNWPIVANHFRSTGIMHLEDVSVTLNNRNEVEKVIDFATRYIEPFW